MRSIIFAIIILTSLIACNKKQTLEYNDEEFYFSLAYRWAPIHYQDTDSDQPKADYITKFDLDGNFDAIDNWDNVFTSDLSAYMYYSVVETSTHWFINYMSFHARDWDDAWFAEGEHENDSEGILQVIKKETNNKYGSFVCAITVAHEFFHSYIPEGSNITINTDFYSNSGYIHTLDKMDPNWRERYKGFIQFGADESGVSRPKTFQEAKTHAFLTYPSGDFQGSPGQDGVIYYPSKTVAEIPVQSSSPVTAKYQLINLAPNNSLETSLWNLQIYQAVNPGNTYAWWGTFIGNDGHDRCGQGVFITCSENSASPPWGWDNSYDKLPRGILAIDPVSIVTTYFSNLGEFSLIYTKNKYLHDLKKNGFNNANKPVNMPADLNLDEIYTRLVEEDNAIPIEEPVVSDN